MKTKERILETALALFNTSNTQAATTNHIAAAMGMSPGNLHYHYKNREEIIFSLYEQMHQKLFPDVAFIPQTLQALALQHQQFALIAWEYRFFYRELLFLLSRDERLKERFKTDNLAYKHRIEIMLRTFHDKGWVHLPLENMVLHLSDTILLFLQFWHPFLESIGGTMDEYAIKGGVRRIEGTLRSFLTPEGLRILASIES
ncbi:MAG: TetR/AcrR family transcriptional regulator [Campylobacterales bacterium]|nr:TetR/AcrR family transcriptional regulator [Campylobacterales bacterium]